MALNYWRSHKYTTDSLDDVNWNIISTAYRTLPFSCRSWATKLASDWLPTNKNMKCWNLGPTQKCPFCGGLEDALHIQTCSHPIPSTYHRQQLEDLLSKLMKLNTTPLAISTLLDGLKSAWSKTSEISSYFTPE